MKCRKYLVLFSFFVMNSAGQPVPNVTIEQGVLTGKISKDGKFFEYVGIPYATTNISGRFQAPQPPPKWDGVFKAVDEFIQCPQPTAFGVVGTEECLSINVYAPTGAKGPLPVMVYVHGGAFLLGSGGKILLGADFLVKHDVILVTFNYRLGIFGFLCLDIKEAPGNASLKDQIAALKWVQKNIAAFGGDPDNVTLFGHSAGATSVSFLLASKATEGLFHKAIMQSGSSIANWGLQLDPIMIASETAKELGHDSKDPQELYDIFAKTPYKELINVTVGKPLGQLLISNLLHLPCIEKVFPDSEPVITDLPINLLKNAPKNISVIYGSNDKEGLFFVSEVTNETLAENNKLKITGSDFKFSSDLETDEVTSKVKEFYFGENTISWETRMILSDFYTHLYFEMPVIMESEMILSQTNASVYNYYFTYSGGRNMVKQISGFRDVIGACHGDDILYFFQAYVWPFEISEKDKIMIDWMTKMWTNFAKYGNPTPQFDETLPTWKASSKDNLNFLYIGDELKMGSLPNEGPYTFWKDLYSKYRRTNLL